MSENTTDDAPDTGLVWGTTSFVPGADVGLVSRNTIGLVERDNPSTRERLWALVADDAPLDDILDELSATGLKSLPDFGLVQVEGDNVRVVARGRTTITAELSSGSNHEIDASAVRTWIEEVVTDVVALTISLPPSHDSSPDASSDDASSIVSGDGFAVLAGSVPASSLTRRYDEPDAHAAAAAATDRWTVGDGLSSDPDVDDRVADDIDDAEDAEPKSPPAPELELADESGDHPSDLGGQVLGNQVNDDDLGGDASGHVVPAPSNTSTWLDDAGSSQSPTDDGDDPIVQTPSGAPERANLPWMKSADSQSSEPSDPQPLAPSSDAPSEPSSDAPSEPSSGARSVQDPAPSSPPIGPVPGVVPSRSPPDSTVIVAGASQVPFDAGADLAGSLWNDASGSVEPAGGGSSGSAGSGRPDSADVASSGSIGSGRPDSADVASSGSIGMGSSANHEFQSDVGATDFDEPSMTEAAIAVLSFSDGQRIDVDRAVLIGRNPKVAGATDDRLPHMMKFEGPGQGLSRTHAEIRIEEGDLVLEDLKSTNGTEVQLPGQQRRRLRAGEPVVIVAGTLIDFGDELHCTVENVR